MEARTSYPSKKRNLCAKTHQKQRHQPYPPHCASELLMKYGIKDCSVVVPLLTPHECRLMNTDLPKVDRTSIQSDSRSHTKQSKCEFLEEHGFASCSVLLTTQCPEKEFSIYHGAQFFREAAEDIHPLEENAFNYREFYRQTYWNQCSCLNQEQCKRKVNKYLKSLQNFVEFINMREDLIKELRLNQRRKIFYADDEFVIVQGNLKVLREALRNRKLLKVKLTNDPEASRLAAELFLGMREHCRSAGTESVEEPKVVHIESASEENLPEQNLPNHLEDVEHERVPMQPDNSESDSVAENIGSSCKDPEKEKDISSSEQNEHPEYLQTELQTKCLNSCLHIAMASCSPKVLLHRLDPSAYQGLDFDLAEPGDSYTPTFEPEPGNSLTPTFEPEPGNSYTPTFEPEPGDSYTPTLEPEPGDSYTPTYEAELIDISTFEPEPGDSYIPFEPEPGDSYIPTFEPELIDISDDEEQEESSTPNFEL